MGDGDDFFDILGGFLDPFGFFDFNRDGRHSPGELFIAEQTMLTDDITDTGTASRRVTGSGSGLAPASDSFDDEKEFEEEFDEAETDSGDLRSACAAGTINITFKTSRTYPHDGESQAYPHDGESQGGVQLRRKEARDWLAHIRNYPDAEDGALRETHMKRSRFILDNPGLVAADYCSVYYGFDCLRAVIENYGLPEELLDNYDLEKAGYAEMLSQTEDYDAALAVGVFARTVEDFLPYAEFDAENLGNMLMSICFFNMSRDFSKVLIDYLSAHKDFVADILRGRDQIMLGLDRFLCDCLEAENTSLALWIFNEVMNNKLIKMNQKVNFISGIINKCSRENEVEAAEALRDILLPVVEGDANFLIQRSYPRWLREIDKYITNAEKHNDKYKYTRRNAWRLQYKDKNVGADPLQYASEEDFLEAIKPLEDKHREALSDPNIYIYCGVWFIFGRRTYHYRTEDDTLKIGDNVLVPVGEAGEEEIGQIVSIQYHKRISVPFPLERTKFIIRKVDRASDKDKDSGEASDA